MISRHVVINVAITLPLLMVGCGGPTLFMKPGAVPGQFEADRYACQVQWDQSGPGIAYARDPLGSMGYLIIRNSDIDDCLRHRGWQEQGDKP